MESKEFSYPVSHSFIISKTELEHWLKNAPPELGASLAVRAALRVMPLVFKVVDYKEIPNHLKSKLLARAFRAGFTSWAACKYSNIEVTAAARSAAYEAFEGFSYANEATSATDAAVAAVHSTALSDHISIVAAVDAAAAAVRLDSAKEDDIWRATTADIDWLTHNNREGLIDQPLWPSDMRGSTRYSANFPLWARNPFDAFQKVGPKEWNFWHKWYRSILPNGPKRVPESAFGEEIDLKIASQSSKF